MNLEIKKFNELTVEELYEILRVRSEVFVVEQNCVYNDQDGKDIESIHIMIVEGAKIMAYLRVIKPGVSYDDASIGRVLVTSEARKKGLARKIVCAGINYIINNWNENKITIGAQNYLRDFYESLGFEAVSEVYSEDGIPHLDMTYNKK
ncbi:GNAT family N-acetyltransferase [Psychrilyobacter atlanticus]|uniref:GNAT family N-acetyltransferase n=1 Tax=Psychrilyobacter atlanticus TaxID=271091 RepID=UPI00041DD47C|nr:GNAT family N-acetyltransferase [Psychrilyobacter atlanticus]